jgi:MFS family permease
MTNLTLVRKQENWQDYFVWLEGIFYFFQGFYLVGVQVYMGVMMAEWELPLTAQATIGAIAMAPAFLKMFTGLLSDRVPIYKWGRRKPYIILGAVLYVPAFVMLLSIKEFSNLWIAAIAVAMAAWVLVDGTLDALTVDVTPDEKTGTMQGAANGARAFGMGLGFLVVPILGPKTDWTPVLIIIGAFAIIQAVTVMFFREIPITRKDLREELPVGRVLKETFGKAQSWLSIGFAFFVLGPSAIRAVASSYLLTIEGWSESEQLMQAYGIVNVVSFLGVFAGSMVVGRIISKYKNNFKVFVLISAFAWLLMSSWMLLMKLDASPVLVGIIQLLYGFGSGLIVTSAYSVVMQVCPTSIEGFFFATLTSFMNIGYGAIAPVLITRLGNVFGSVIPAFYVALVYTVIALVFLFFILKGLNKKQEPIEDIV